MIAVVGHPWGLGALAHLPVTERYVFFLNFSHLVPAHVLKAYECVNFHCTPLPYGRGGHPIENMIQRGHTETVITAHRMVDELDAGPIYCVSGPVSLSGTKAQILKRFERPVAEMMRYISEQQPEPKAQEGEPVYFKRLPEASYKKFWEARG